MHTRFWKPFIGTTLLSLTASLLIGCQNAPAAETIGESIPANSSAETSALESMAIADRLDCPLNELLDYLQEAGAGTPYAYARILITVKDTLEEESESSTEVSAGEFRQDIVTLEGTADISWQTFPAAEAFEEYYAATEKEMSSLSDEEDSFSIAFVYYQYQLAEEIHAIDINRSLVERYDREDNPLYAITISNRPDSSSYCFSQSGERELVLMDHAIYGLELKEISDESQKDAVSELLLAFTTRKENVKEYNGWVMDEETLYWFDHEERVTHLENPTRVFTEVKAKDSTWEGALDTENFAMLTEADYQIRIYEGGPLLQLHFSLTDEIPREGYETFLCNGFCTDETYKMNLINPATNEMLQGQDVSLSIEMPDMITFTDLDEDGYLDMRIGHPTHWNGGRAQMDEYAHETYMLWNPTANMFESRSETEVAQMLQQTQENTTLTKYIVQPGDTLWGISRWFYGTGTRYPEIERENADVLSASPYLLPGMVLELSEDP